MPRASPSMMWLASRCPLQRFFRAAHRGAKYGPYLQRSVLFSQLFHLSLCCSQVRFMVLRMSNSAHALWTTAMSACSESPWMITLGCPTYRANAVRLRLANGPLLPCFSRGMATICLYTVTVATQTVIIGTSSSVFRRQWSHFVTGVLGWTCDRASCLFSLPPARRQTLHQDCFRPSLVGSPGAGTSIATGSSRLLTSRSISSSTGGRSRASPLVPHQQVPATSEQRLDLAEQKRPTKTCEFNSGTVKSAHNSGYQFG